MEVKIGFFNFDQKVVRDDLKGISLDFLHKHQCRVCPLNNQPGLRNPHMPAYGTESPIVYFLGEAPGRMEDQKGIPFVGKAGKVLKYRINDDWLPYIRWNNCVRTRPPENRNPSTVELECCRPSIIQDIEQSKPVAIFGFGNVPLQWALGQAKVTKWTGRRVPVQVGSHTCWYYPMLHPSYVLRSRKFTPRKKSEYGSDIEFVFAKHLEKAFAEVEDLPEPVVHTKEKAFDNIDWVTGADGEKDVQRVIDFLNSVYDDYAVGVDFETNALRPYKKSAKILSVAIASEKHGSFSFPIYHPDAQWTARQLKRVQLAFEDFLYEAPCIKAVHNLAFEHEWVGYFYGEDSLRATPWECTMSQAFILDERQGALSLEFLCVQYFGINVKEISGVDRKNLESEDVNKVCRYNGLDAKYHLFLFLAQEKELKRQKLIDVYREHVRRIPTMVLTQLKGVPVNSKIVKQFYEDYVSDLEDIEKEISELSVCKKFKKIKGEYFRPSSNPDILFMLNDVLNLDVEKTDEVVLRDVDNPIAELILEWRGTNKLLSTYVKPLMAGSDTMYSDGKIHPIISTCRTRTWRTSSDSPNIQNFPKREHKEIRRQVTPGSDLRVVSFDYSGIQARNVAMESKDKALVAAFWDRYDIHTDWMERIEKHSPGWIKGGVKKLSKEEIKNYRNKSKNGLVFPSFFGAQERKISTVLQIPINTSKDLLVEFWDEFPDIKGWHEQLFKFYNKHGYVTGLSGFRRRAPVSPNELINAPIQADEAIIVCDSMTRLSEMEEDRFQASMEIHDDLTFIWPKKDVERNAEVVIKAMLNVPFEWAHIVPIGVEMSIGKDWCDQEDVGEYYSDEWDGIVEFEKSLN